MNRKTWKSHFVSVAAAGASLLLAAQSQAGNVATVGDLRARHVEDLVVEGVKESRPRVPDCKKLEKANAQNN